MRRLNRFIITQVYRFNGAKLYQINNCLETVININGVLVIFGNTDHKYQIDIEDNLLRFKYILSFSTSQAAHTKYANKKSFSIYTTHLDFAVQIANSYTNSSDRKRYLKYLIQAIKN